MNIEQYVNQLGEQARTAATVLATTATDQKDRALANLIAGLKAGSNKILAANDLDLVAAKEQDLSAAMIDRLRLTPERIDDLCQSVRDVTALADPVGDITGMTLRPNGLQVGKMRIPLGVVAFIYESRPNVTVDGAILCLKSGNAVILRGGKETINTNRALAEIIGAALKQADLPSHAVQVVNTTDRTVVEHLLKMEGSIDLLIPRGGEQLIRYVNENSRVPVLKHYKGVCHVYVDKDADLDQALPIAMNSKTHRPGVCNAAETLLVHEKVADQFLPGFITEAKASGLELRGCPATVKYDAEYITPATESDWPEEYLDMILSVKVVGSAEEAIAHIGKYGSDHTEAIVTENYTTAHHFVRAVQSSLVLVNASTRFNDGGQLGLGAEIGISTTKLHAFGPMGLQHLTIEKYIAFGNGQVRQ